MKKESRKETLIKEIKKGKEIKEIARELGLNVSYVYKIIKTNNITRTHIRQHTKFKNIISPVHKLLGKYIRKERIYKLEDEAKKIFSDLVGISTQRVTFLERGVYDPTLTDLIKIFKALDISFSELDNIIKESEEE